MRVEWSWRARTDARHIAETIRAHDMAAALRVVDRIEQRIRLLEEFPRLGSEDAETATRELVILTTPYIAIYRIEPDCILILRILHGRQARRR